MTKNFNNRIENNYFWKQVNTCLLKQSNQILCLFVHPTNSHLKDLNPFMLAVSSNSPAVILSYWPDSENESFHINATTSMKNILKTKGIHLKTLHFNSYDIADTIFLGQNIFNLILIFVQHWNHYSPIDYLVNNINDQLKELKLSNEIENENESMIDYTDETRNIILSYEP